MTDTQLLIGEYVERVFDSRFGVVKEISEFQGKHAYRVELAGEPAGEEHHVWGTEQAWRPHFRLHAHVTLRSRDCDGDYSSGHNEQLISTERCSAHGDMDFKERVLMSVISVFAVSANLGLTETGAHYHEITDEGYRSANIAWCEDGCTDDNSWQRSARRGSRILR